MLVHSILFASSQYILPLPIVHTLGCTGTLFVFLIDYLLNNVKINLKQSVHILQAFLRLYVRNVTQSGNFQSVKTFVRY